MESYNSLSHTHSFQTGGIIPTNSTSALKIANIGFSYLDYFKEEYDHYFIEVEAPGFTKEDLHILFKNNILTITGEILVRGTVKTINKTFTIKDANAEDFDITLENGVLQIVAHKKPETLAKILTIK